MSVTLNGCPPPPPPDDPPPPPTSDGAPSGRPDYARIEARLQEPLPRLQPDDKSTFDIAYSGVSLESFKQFKKDSFNVVVARAEAALKSDASVLRLVSEFLTAHVHRLRSDAAVIPPFHEVPGDPKEWSFFSLAKVALLLLASIVLLGIGIQSIARTLMASGVTGFDTPVVAYLFAFVPVAAALALKNLSSALTTERHRRRYAVVVGLIGLAFATAWCCLFVQTFSPTGFSIDVFLDNTATHATGEEDTTGTLLILSQLLAEIFLGAALWLEIERIHEQHRPAGTQPNPSAKSVKGPLDAALLALQHNEEVLGRVSGVLNEIEAGRNSYVSAAEGLFLRVRHFAFCALDHLAQRTPQTLQPDNFLLNRLPRSSNP